MKLCNTIAIVLLLCSVPILDSCHKSPRHVATVGASGISVAVYNGEQIAEHLYDAQLLTAQESGTAVKGIDKLATANDVFIAHIRSLPVIDASNKAQVVAWFGELAGVAQDLNNQGVLNVKNPDAHKQFDDWALAMQASLNGIALLVNSFSGSTTGPQFAAQVTAAAQHTN